MAEYLKLKYLPTSPPEGTFVAKCTELQDGDQLFGARYQNSTDWTYWLGIIIKGTPEEGIDDMSLPFFDENLDLTVHYSYSKKLEFLVFRPSKNVVKDYPHKCPRCGQPAYINIFNVVDCQAKCH